MQRWPHKYTASLTAALAADSTQISLAILPTLAIGDWCHLTIEGKQGGVLVDEIVKAEQTTAGLLLTRAVYGAARAWPIGTKVECRIIEADMQRAGASTGAAERITAVSLDPNTGIMTITTGQ